jgi:hypothetical protein
MPPSEAFSNARAAALKALEIDATLAGAHAALAGTQHHSWDWTGAERGFKKAIEFKPMRPRIEALRRGSWSRSWRNYPSNATFRRT